VDHTRLVPTLRSGNFGTRARSLYTAGIPCLWFRNQLFHLSSLRRPMGCFSSKPVQTDSPSATGREVTQRQSSPATQPVARAPECSSQHSRANAGHESPPVEEVSMRERPRSNPTPQERPPMGFGEDSPPQVPSHRIRAKLIHASSSRDTSTPVIPGEYYRRWSA
jgi:hypothetical protein